MKGCDSNPCQGGILAGGFNSRSLHRMRQIIIGIGKYNNRVSIHVTLCGLRQTMHFLCQFLFVVSIHAPCFVQGFVKIADKLAIDFFHTTNIPQNQKNVNLSLTNSDVLH
jgi:hypothetical protein